MVKALYENLNADQKKVICFDWDHKEKARGLLRTYISNNWRITKPGIKTDFFSSAQPVSVASISRWNSMFAWRCRYMPTAPLMIINSITSYPPAPPS
jgi:hypothetical protein